MSKSSISGSIIIILAHADEHVAVNAQPHEIYKYSSKREEVILHRCCYLCLCRFLCFSMYSYLVRILFTCYALYGIPYICNVFVQSGYPTLYTFSVTSSSLETYCCIKISNKSFFFNYFVGDSSLKLRVSGREQNLGLTHLTEQGRHPLQQR
jgi:hypothetical protein